MTTFPLFSLLGSPSRPLRRWLGMIALATALLLLAGCDKTGQMNDQPRYDPLASSDLFPNGQSARVPVAGSVPYGGDVSPNSPALTGLDANGQPLKGWPVTVDKALLQTGQERFNIYCVVCHGAEGQGNGKVVALYNFPKPPSLTGDNVKALSNGDIFAVITNGKGKMFPYGYRVKPNERWAVIAYLRAIQLKNGAVNVPDLTQNDIDQIGKQP